jgi:hypothetical protein
MFTFRKLSTFLGKVKYFLVIWIYEFGSRKFRSGSRACTDSLIFLIIYTSQLTVKHLAKVFPQFPKQNLTVAFGNPHDMEFAFPFRMA